MDEFLNPEEIMELSKRKKPKYGLDKDIEDTQKEMEEVTSAQKENPEFIRGYDQRLIDLSKKLQELNNAKRSITSAGEIKPETKSPIVNAMGQDNSSTMEKYGMDVTSEFPNYKAFEEQPMVPQMARMSPSDKREVESLFGANKTEMPEGLLPFAQGAQPSMPLISEEKVMPQMAGGVRAPVSSDQKQMQDFVDAQRVQDSNYMNRLKEAEERSRDIELASMLGKAFSQIGGGIAQAKAKADLGKMDTSVYDQLGKTSQRPLEELKRSVEMEKDDPNSDASKSLRSMAKADLEKVGVKLDLGNMSYNQLTSVFPHLSRMAERIESAKLRQQVLAENRQERAERKEEEIKLKVENQVNKRFDSYTKEEIARIQGADRIFDLTGKIRRGDLKGSANIRNQLTAEINQLAMPAGTRAGVSDRTRTQIDTYYTRFKDFVNKVTSTPSDTIPEKYLQQIESEARALQNGYRRAISEKAQSLESGTGNKYAKEIIRSRASTFLEGYEGESSYPPHIEAGIKAFMKANNVNREEAIKTLQQDGRIQ
jgi:hypothetical protein